MEALYAGIVLQRQLESRAFELGNKDYSAPGQLVGDLIAGKPSSTFGDVLPSYKPGVTLGVLHPSLPACAIETMRDTFPAFGRKIKGFDCGDAVLTGVETRTPSPMQFIRDEAFQSPAVRRLCRRIRSAGVNGVKLGEAVARAMARLSS